MEIPKKQYFFTNTLKKNKEKKEGQVISIILSSPIKNRILKEWNILKQIGLIQMIIVVAALWITVNIYIRDLALDLLSLSRWQSISIVASLFILVSFLLDLLVSLTEAKKFTDNNSGKINIPLLWKKIFTNPLGGFLLIIVVMFSITNANDLSEYYRIHVTTWHDSELWALEKSIFNFLRGSLIDMPKFWDRIYFLLWVYIMIGYCILYRLRRFYDLIIFSMTTVLSFFLTRLAAIHYPTAGPAFYQPEFFDLSGTVSGDTQRWLILYMKGGVPQNGLIPGTMGMPSLHVGLTVMTAWFLARNLKWTIWASIPWICLTWISTVMLGWHYVLDGFGGVILIILVIPISHGLLFSLGFLRYYVMKIELWN